MKYMRLVLAALLVLGVLAAPATSEALHRRGRPGYVFPTFGGDGSDGAYAPAGDDTLTFTSAGKQHTSVVIAPGATITIATDGTNYGQYLWGCSGDFTLGAGATITLVGLGSAPASITVSTASSANGANGLSSVPGYVDSWLGGRQHGRSAGGPVGCGGGGGGASATYTGGVGGRTAYNSSGTVIGGGTAGPAGSGAGGNGQSYAYSTVLPHNWYMLPNDVQLGAQQSPAGGAGGGNGGGRGGTGGSNGGNLFLEINGLALGTGTITASGSAAPAENAVSDTGPGKGATNCGSGGGGAGGSGGKISVAYRLGTCDWTLTATAGTKANGASAPTGGFAGGDGSDGAPGRTKAWKVW